MSPWPSSPLIDRRTFLAMAGSAWAASLAPRAAMAMAATDAVYAAAFRDPDGTYGLATVTERGDLVERVRLPARAHGLCHSPVAGRAVAFARRPGTFALVVDLSGRTPPLTIAAAEGRHFFGHGCFSQDGRLLYATENDIDAGQGMIGVYDGTDGYRRIGEFPSYGIGPHDMALSPGGQMLIVANGGIETHPDFGRTKLNLDRMQPSLALIGTESGALIERHAMPPDLAQLSTRHVDLGADGRIWFACQYEGPRNDLPPLAGSFRPGEDIRFLSLPEEASLMLANYVGAIAVNRESGLVGLASPKGGAVVTVEASSGRLIETRSLIDAAGIAAARSGFAVSSYDGLFAQTQSALAWDQHIARIAA